MPTPLRQLRTPSSPITVSCRRSLLSSRAGADRKGAPFLGSLRYSRLCEMTRGSPLSLGPYGPASGRSTATGRRRRCLRRRRISIRTTLRTCSRHRSTFRHDCSPQKTSLESSSSRSTRSTAGGTRERVRRPTGSVSTSVTGWRMCSRG